jgi:hypothetical protein
VWNYATLGFPFLEVERVIDPMIQAGVSNLPTDLESASRYLGGEGKQKDGKKLIKLFCVENADPHEHPEKWERFLAYARQDIEAMRDAYRKTRPLPLNEWQQYWAFEHINRRGVTLDMPFVLRAEALAAEDGIASGRRLAKLTGGAVTRVTQARRIATWLFDQLPDATMREVLTVGVPADEEDDVCDDNGDDEQDAGPEFSLRRERVERLIALLEVKRANGGLSADETKAHEAATIRLFGAGASPKKFARLAAQQVDGVLRDQYRFSGGFQTGRMSSKGAQCVTGDHEALTRHGWRRLDELTGPCEIMAWSRDGTMSWESGVVNAFGAPEQVVHIYGTVIRGTYTLGHRMPNRHYGCAKLVDYTPQMLIDRDAKVRSGFIITGTVIQADAPLTDAQLRLRVAMQADGNWADRAARWQFTKVRKIERLEMLLDEPGVPFCRKAAKNGVTRFRIATAAVPSWLVKDFGPWVLSLSARQAALVLKEIREWDGYSHKRGHLQIASPRKDQMEWVVTIAALAGRAATLHWYPAAKSARGRWVVYIRSSITTSLQPSELEIAKGSNPVFCPTVPSGYWLCRVSDRVLVTGNTQNLSRDVLGKDGIAEAPLVDAIADGCSYAELAAASPTDVPVARKLALLVRPALIAAPKKTLVWSDWSAIEARITPWLAASEGGEAILDVYRANDRDPSLPDIYTIAAANILHKDPREVTKPERQTGKVATLALQFLGSVGALKAMALSYRIHLDDFEARRIVDAWRQANRWAMEFGGAHNEGASYGLWGAALSAWEIPGTITTAGRLAFVYREDYLGGTLFMALPSCRLLTYPRPRWRDVDILDKDGKPTGEKRTELSFRRARGRARLWRGVLAENSTQAVAADILRATVTRIETNPPYDFIKIRMTCHDEIVVECDEDRAGDAKAILRREMLTLPDWADGLPLQSEESACSYYTKAKAALRRR